MTRTPPNRRGIKFEVGAPLEARDSLKNWYVASIEKIDYDEERVLIHYRQWSHRYDEWFDWSSSYLRPMERIQLRKEGLRESSGGSRFHMNDKVLASWSDCRFYPARVLAVNKDASYTVKFFDGVVQTVKDIHVKSFHRNRKGGKSKSEEKNKAKAQFRKQQNEKNGRSRGERGSAENGNVKSRRVQESSLDRAASGEGEGGAGKKRGMEEEQVPAKMEDLGVETGRQTSGALGGKSDRGAVPAREGGRRVLRELPGRPGAGEANGVGVQEEGEPGGQSADSSPLQELMEVKAEVEISEHLKAGLEEAPYQNGGRQTRPAEGAAETPREVLELRKRKICLGQSPPSKRSKPDISTEKPGSVESKPAELDPPTATVAVAKADRETLDIEGQTETPKPPTELGPDPAVQAPLVRKTQQPNPNKYSREPLYRVVKNQPPPVLSINLDHNPFKCRAPGCHKSFRKAKLLHYHVKYYHEGDEAAEADLSPPRSVQTRASERQEAALDTPRTRRTTSTHLSSTHRTLYPSRMGKLNERKRTLAPPGGGAGNRQRPSLQEKSRENHMEKLRCKVLERDPNTADAVARERAKEAKIKDFLRIRLKKKKKKKRKKSKSDEDSGSDWSTDSPVWSTEELQELDAVPGVTAPGLGSDVVRCICKVQEENDFMIQCEECLSWQHGACMGLMEDNVPERYTCYICRYLPGQRQSLHYRHDSDWLDRGHMYGLPFLEENYSDQSASKITAAHQLLGDVHHVIEVLNGLQLKISVLQSQSHPELQLWCQPWKRAEKPKKTASTEKGLAPPAALGDNAQDGDGMYHSTLVGGEKMGHTAAQDSYISSEHCYQKPHTYYPATEQRLVVETRDSELEDSLRSTEDLLTLEHRYGVPLDPDRGKIQPSLQLEWPTNAKKADGCRKQSGDRGGQVKSEPAEAEAEGSLQQQWQINLLDHIEAVQEEVTHRMDFIERELDVLESWLDHTGELEPPEPLARLPQLKLRIKQLLTDLGKVQQIALCCST
ncbi:PHD finger protein 20b isoform X2 [Paramormyrops kingsleyae]|uniref:PHD finger protein 20b isoform X2 n=1 Tax=Paramormyrops kingsleyae TaxID=1676925 RepID=UPI003B96F151